MSETRLVRVSAELLSFMGTRTEDGRKLTYEWGEPVAHVEAVWSPDGAGDWGEDHDGFPVYEPIVTATDDGSRFCGCPK